MVRYTRRRNICRRYNAGLRIFFGAGTGGGWNYAVVGNTYGEHKAALHDDSPLMINVWKYEEERDETVGHSTMGIGYASSTSGTPYLATMEGWNRYGTFMRLGYYDEMVTFKIWVR